jgi:hypothetical protein
MDIEKEITEIENQLKDLKIQLNDLIFNRDILIEEKCNVNNITFKEVPLLNSNGKFVWTCLYKNAPVRPIALMQVEDKRNNVLIKHWYLSASTIIFDLDDYRIPFGEGKSKFEAYKSFEDRLQKLEASGELIRSSDIDEED